MLNSTTIAIILLFVGTYAILGTIYFCVASVRNLLKERNALKKNLVVADEYIQDLENEAGGYSLMATAIETLQGELEDLHKWAEAQEKHTNEHCRQIQELANIRVQFMVAHSMSEDYTGPDECNEEPYKESDCPTLPEPVSGWFEVEGLDTL